MLDEQGRYGPVALQYGPTEGAPSLRDLVASAAHAEDGRTTVDGVLTTTGSQQALDLLARVLVDPGDAIVVEHPAYLGSLQAFSAAGARFVEIPSDRDGMQTDVLERQLQAGLRPKACSVVPNFHNPTGATLAAHRREHLASLAERYGFVVIEDDPYHALRFGGDDSRRSACTASSPSRSAAHRRCSRRGCASDGSPARPRSCATSSEPSNPSICTLRC